VKMGEFANAGWLKFTGWMVTGGIIILNVKLLWDMLPPL
jgi:Mn2+/Fe2+ NRAMP family transporter